MKDTLYILYILFSINIYSQKIEQGIITYQKSIIEKVYEKKKPNNSSHYEEFKEIEEKTIEALKQIEFVLTFKNGESNFEVIKSLLLETDKYAMLAVIPLGNRKFYNDKNQNLWEGEAFGQLFLVSREIFNWKLLNETKKIGNYTCYKAETFVERPYDGKMKRHPITAWYCPKINVPFGPIGISGLPGLILEVEKNNRRYTATKIILNPNKRIEIEKLTKGKKITEQKLSAMFDRARSNFKKDYGLK